MSGHFDSKKRTQGSLPPGDRKRAKLDESMISSSDGKTRAKKRWRGEF